RRQLSVHGFAALLLASALTSTISPVASHAAIVTTLPPLAGLVRMLDTDADVRCLLSPGADAHEFQLSPRQVQALKQANLLIRSSYDDGHWSGLSLPGRTFDLWPKTAHAWLSPQAVRQQLPHLAAVLQQLAPQRKQRIAENLTQALKQCDAMDQALKNALAPYRKSGVIMQHNAWAKVLESYAVPIWSILESHHHGANIRPRSLESALAQLTKHPTAVLWGNHQHANRGLIWLQKHRAGNGAKEKPLLLLNPLGACHMNWIQLMQANLQEISP
ncbi:MAG: metal ABC transporter substrate-binding protein, partial [Mariprofundaceae bacterium]